MREAYGVFACNGILFNHESPRRGTDFVTRRAARGAARYRAWRRAGGMGAPPLLRLGNLDAKRDWGHARDYVQGMWLILQQPEADDYVLAPGQARSVRQLVEIAFGHPEVGVTIRWEGAGADECGCDQDGHRVVAIDPQHYRPSEVPVLLGDWRKAQEVLQWRPATSFEALVDEMLRTEIARLAETPVQASE